MISKSKLEQFKAQKLSDVKLEDLKEITSIHIDTDRPVLERILSFMVQIGNPYIYKVNDTPIKVSFTKGAPSLEESLITIFTKSY